MLNNASFDTPAGFPALKERLEACGYRFEQLTEMDGTRTCAWAAHLAGHNTIGFIECAKGDCPCLWFYLDGIKDARFFRRDLIECGAVENFDCNAEVTGWGWKRYAKEYRKKLVGDGDNL
jgi:hypothetical protein